MWAKQISDRIMEPAESLQCKGVPGMRAGLGSDLRKIIRLQYLKLEYHIFGQSAHFVTKNGSKYRLWWKIDGNVMCSQHWVRVNFGTVLNRTYT